MKKTILMILVVLLLGLTQASQAFDVRAYKVDPNDQVMVTLLTMVINDLQMCRSTLKAKFVDNLLSIGHLNNAQSALKRTDLPDAYRPLVAEILERIGKIKFYLVMNDLQNATMRMNQLIGVVGAVLGAETYGGVVVPNNGGYNPTSGKPFIPVEISPTGPGNFAPVTPGGMPAGVNPISN
jgi:hypothetical protein